MKFNSFALISLLVPLMVFAESPQRRGIKELRILQPLPSDGTYDSKGHYIVGKSLSDACTLRMAKPGKIEPTPTPAGPARQTPPPHRAANRSPAVMPTTPPPFQLTGTDRLMITNITYGEQRMDTPAASTASAFKALVTQPAQPVVHHSMHLMIAPVRGYAMVLDCNNVEPNQDAASIISKNFQDHFLPVIGQPTPPPGYVPHLNNPFAGHGPMQPPGYDPRLLSPTPISTGQ